MSDSDDSKKRDLILSGNRSLAIQKLNLVKRGLELIKELKKRQLKVVIGNSDNGITEIISECVKEVIANKYDLQVRSFFYGEELLEQAENGTVDIFIMMLENIRFRPVYPPQERLQNSIQLITQIKTICGRPVIALAARSLCLEDPSLVTRSKMAGSDFFFPMPFKIDALIKAIEKCLDMLSGFDEVSRKRLKERPGYDIT